MGIYERLIPRRWRSMDLWVEDVEERRGSSLGSFLFVALLLALALVLMQHLGFAGVDSLPGEDASDKLHEAGTLLRILDTGLFKWLARIFSGICVMSSAWALKEQRFGVATICVVGAIIFGTAPKWVKNIFEIGGNSSLFSQVERGLPHTISLDSWHEAIAHA